VQLNSESLATIFSAIDKLKGLSDDLPGFYFTCHQANENKERKEEILEFMNDSLFNCTAVDKNNELSLVLSCQIFFLPLSALIVPHWFVDFLSIRFCGLP
jgi:hypothetical protein